MRRACPDSLIRGIDALCACAWICARDIGFAAALVVATVATTTSAGAAGTTKVQVPVHLCKTATADRSPATR